MREKANRRTHTQMSFSGFHKYLLFFYVTFNSLFALFVFRSFLFLPFSNSEVNVFVVERPITDEHAVKLLRQMKGKTLCALSSLTRNEFHFHWFGCWFLCRSHSSSLFQCMNAIFTRKCSNRQRNEEVEKKASCTRTHSVDGKLWWLLAEWVCTYCIFQFSILKHFPFIIIHINYMGWPKL